MLDTYPYYQEKLRNRQKLINRAKRVKEDLEKSGRPIKYRFEEQIRGRANLYNISTPNPNVIDIETDKQAEEFDKYV